AFFQAPPPATQSAGRTSDVSDASRGKAMPQATISLELSSTGLRIASREESTLGTDGVVVIVFIRCSRGTKGPPMRTLPASSRGLRPNGSVCLVDDDLAVRHLRRILEDPLELLVAHPLGCDTSRLLGLGPRVEVADRAHDALAGVDEEVAAEAGQLAQARRQTL